MFKKLFGSSEEHAFVRVVSSEITKLRLESAAYLVFAADQRTFAMAAQYITRAVASNDVPPQWKAAHPRALAWTLVDESICDIGVGGDASRNVSESFYRYFDNEKRKDVESVCGPKTGWGLHMM